MCLCAATSTAHAVTGHAFGEPDSGSILNKKLGGRVTPLYRSTCGLVSQAKYLYINDLSFLGSSIADPLVDIRTIS